MHASNVLIASAITTLYTWTHKIEIINPQMAMNQFDSSLPINIPESHICIHNQCSPGNIIGVDTDWRQWSHLCRSQPVQQLVHFLFTREVVMTQVQVDRRE